MSSKRIKDLTVNGIDYRLASSGEGGSVDIIDNLTSTDSDAALSANQGKILNDKINNLNTDGSNVSVTQSLTNGIKIATVTIDGAVTDLFAPENTDTTYNIATETEDGLMSSEDKTKLNNINLDTKVDKTIKVNGKELSSDVTFSASDIGADVSGAAATALTDAKSYTDTKVADKVDKTVTINSKPLSSNINLSASDVGADASGTASNQITSHNIATTTHNDIRLLITGLTERLNALADSDDTTLDQMSEIVAYIKNNKSLIDSITTSKVNVADIINNLTTNVSNKPLAAAQGVALKGLIDALQTEVNNKAKASDLTSHTGNTTAHITSTERTNWNNASTNSHTHSNKSVLDGTTASYTTEEKTKLGGIATGAEVNQNTFSNVVVGSTTIAADAKTDTLTIVAGSNVTITPDATNDKITIAATDTTYSAATKNVAGLMSAADKIKLDAIATGANAYTHPTTSGNKHIPSGGSSGQILRWSADGTAVWGNDNNTTYSQATSSALGLVKIGYTTSGKNYAVALDSNGKMYVNVPWTDNNTTYSAFKAATSSAAGGAGLVPAPAAGAQGKFLRGDGTWQTPTNTTYSNFVKSGSTAAAGLVPAPPTTAGTTKYLREDGTWTAPPNSSAATQSAAGLMSAADKKKLDDVATGATKITVDTALSSTSTNPVQNKVVNTGLAAKAPTSHASTATTYGAGTASNYGHVKLSDNYTSSAGAASAGVAASSKALSDAYNEINSNLSKGLVVDYEYISYSDSDNNQEGALVTTTKTSYSTQIDPITNAHRKFSDYQYLCFELLINSNYVRATMSIPRERFTNQGFTVELFYVDSINTQRWVDIIYKSDTSFYMVGSSNIVANTRVSITGLKAKL